jgi:nicotinate-nucleotide adenylyltransferase
MEQARSGSEGAALFRDRRVAFFGGSFDPPHEGHLAIAHAAKTALQLDAVLFAPVGAQPLKPEGSSAAFGDRVAMTRLAVDGEDGFHISLLDAPRIDGAPNYTLETLVRARTDIGPAGTLFFLMGSDSFFGLRRWHRAAEIPFAAPLIVASRPGQPLDDLIAALPGGLALAEAQQNSGRASEADALAGLASYTLQNQSGAKTPLYLLTGLNFDVSASQVREQMRARGEATDAAPAQVPAAVMAYIRAHGLYR